MTIEQRFHLRSAAVVRKAGFDLGATSEPVKRRGRQAPWFSRRAIATGQRQTFEVAHALNRRTLHSQQLTTPCTPVQPETDSIERNAQRGPTRTVLCEHGRNVRMVMLDCDCRNSALRGD
jgi:hypothetical protein